jgi:DNA-binding CsgD family transcriptional regulator
MADARQALDGIGTLLQARDRALAGAVSAALARRRTDVDAMLAATTEAVDALAAVGPDHLSVAAAGEVAVAAARLPGRGIVPPGPLAAAPGPLQAIHLGWWQLQHALATGDAARVKALADELTALPLPDPRLAVLVDGGGAWSTVVAGTADGAKVIEVAHALADVGLPWDGASLAGAAALRAHEPDQARALLACGRELAVGDGAADATADSDLSDREQAVAALVVDGLTHKEIGARLFISAKTVEHHVARIRQKLGATTRAEMLAALRRDT